MRMRRRADTDKRLKDGEGVFIPTVDVEENVNLFIKEKEYFDFNKLFGNSNDVVVEVGCGQGFFACEYAKAHKSINVMAIERISNVIISGVESAISQGIKNVRFLRTRAECLPKYFPNNSVRKIFLNFSTPLPKKGYAKQRLTSDRYLKIYRDVLIENGEIEQKTDDLSFFEFSIESLKNNGFIIEEIIYDLHKTDKENIVTEYEKKFSQQGLPIYYLRAKKA